MGKLSGASWLSMVKRAFKTPSKERKRKEEPEQEDEEKKREMKKWLFRKLNPAVQVHRSERRTVVVAVDVAAADSKAEDRAAIVIQKVFRGFVARRALKAFKGVIKLQALVRGQNVRRQAKVALRCMQALVRVQDRIRDQRGRLSLEGTRKSTLFNGDSREGVWVARSSSLEEWDCRARKSEEVDTVAQWRKEAAMKREKALAYAFSSKIWRSRRSGGEDDVDEQTRWLERWMATKQWDKNRTCLSERRDGKIKTTDLDSVRSRSSVSAFPVTPRSCLTPPSYFQVRSASPRCYSAAPSPRVDVPNYMTATESAKAKTRCLSTPRAAAAATGDTAKREYEGRRSARKRLNYASSGQGSVGSGLRSPSLKWGSVYDGTEPWSCYTESDSVSPCSSRY